MSYQTVTTTTTYPKVKHTERRTVPCAGGCGRKLKRSFTWSHTINPWNRNGDGTVKTYGQIKAELAAVGAKWAPEPTCVHCEAKANG